jgi:predicted nucleic acid-binding protein
MRVVLDTNVLISALFFAGLPATILAAWSEGRLETSVPRSACEDPDDLKFLSCALAGRARCIVSGDRALVRASGFEGSRSLTPRVFARRHL